MTIHPPGTGLFLVMWQHGDYSDRNEGPICAYLSPEEAERHSDLAAIEEKRIETEEWNRERDVSDPEFRTKSDWEKNKYALGADPDWRRPMNFYHYHVPIPILSRAETAPDELKVFEDFLLENKKEPT